jgi:hypothetical protein
MTRSVHNQRIERLWGDLTKGLTWKWRDFFTQLELYYSLDVENPLHIWLLHYLFLEQLNTEIQSWIEMWNAHKLEMRNETDKSPREMFYFGSLERGIRGLFPPANLGEEIGDYQEYGIDEELQGNELVRNEGTIGLEEPNFPSVSMEFKSGLGETIARTGCVGKSDNTSKCLIWMTALEYMCMYY